mgnify:CR=1 FL=1
MKTIKTNGSAILRNEIATLNSGDQVQYERQFAFGKSGIETTKVVMKTYNKILFSNGHELYIY